MAKSCGAVTLHQGVAAPRRAVTNQQSAPNQPKLPSRNRVNHQTQRCDRADHMNTYRPRPAVGAQVVRPEIRKSGEGWVLQQREITSFKFLISGLYMIVTPVVFNCLFALDAGAAGDKPEFV